MVGLLHIMTNSGKWPVFATHEYESNSGKVSIFESGCWGVDIFKLEYRHVNKTVI